jgi:solute:Na+ symporter, SSS family
LLWSILVMVVVSYITPPPPQEKIEGYTFSLSLFKKETQELKKKPLLDNYRFWSYLLLVFCLTILWIYR